MLRETFTNRKLFDKRIVVLYFSVKNFFDKDILDIICASVLVEKKSRSDQNLSPNLLNSYISLLLILIILKYITK